MYRRSWTTIVGLVLILVGIPMLVCPGPGALLITTGLALLLTGQPPGRAGTGPRPAPLEPPIDAPYRIRESERSAGTMAGRSPRDPDA